MSSINYIVTSPYYTLEEMNKFSNNKSNLFMTVSLNCQSLPSKSDNLKCSMSLLQLSNYMYNTK